MLRAVGQFHASERWTRGTLRGKLILLKRPPHGDDDQEMQLRKIWCGDTALFGAKESLVLRNRLDVLSRQGYAGILILRVVRTGFKARLLVFLVLVFAIWWLVGFGNRTG
jgi:hypothetical protein